MLPRFLTATHSAMLGQIFPPDSKPVRVLLCRHNSCELRSVETTYLLTSNLFEICRATSIMERQRSSKRLDRDVISKIIGHYAFTARHHPRAKFDITVRPRNNYHHKTRVIVDGSLQPERVLVPPSHTDAGQRRSGQVQRHLGTEVLCNPNRVAELYSAYALGCIGQSATY